MSTPPRPSDLGLPDQEAAALGEDGATRIRLFRIIVLLAQELRTLMDQLLREDQLTTQQAALITIVDTLGQPSMKQAATALGTTHQNIKQLASSLARKGFIRFLEDPTDARVRRLATTAKSHSTWQRRSAERPRTRARMVLRALKSRSPDPLRAPAQTPDRSASDTAVATRSKHYPAVIAKLHERWRASERSARPSTLSSVLQPHHRRSPAPPLTTRPDCSPTRRPRPEPITLALRPRMQPADRLRQPTEAPA